MNSEYKFITGILLGAAAGAALALFLNSEKGKEIIDDVKGGTNKLDEDLHAKWEEVDTVLNDLLVKGRSFLEELEQKISQSAS
jgi:gas vesicle protein